MVAVDETGEPRSWPAGWYADPWFSGQERFWDGNAWTPHVKTTVPAPPPPLWPGASGTPSSAPLGTSPESGQAGAGGTEPWGRGSLDRTAPVPAWDASPAVGTTSAWEAAQRADPGDSFAPSWAAPHDGGNGWLRPPPEEPSRRRPGKWVAVAVIAVVVAVAAAAITVANGAGRHKRVAARLPIANGGTGPSNRSPAPSTTVPPAASTDPGAPLLNRIDVAQADAPAGYTVTLLQGGNLVAGQVTLDLCSGTYASESLRTARRQVDLDDSTGQTALSTEAVLYTSPSATAQAFAELKARAANCPQSFLPPPPGEDGLPPAKTTFSTPPDGSWPNVAGVDRLAYAFTTTTQDGNSENSIAVYLRHGRALLGLYFSNPGQTVPAVAGKTTVEGIVGVFEQRLAQLPAGAVNATVPAPPPTGGI